MSLSAQHPTHPPEKYLFIKTYGCQMNVYDSDRMAELLLPLGYKKTDDPSHANIIILNTCHIREKATEKVFSELGRIRKLKLTAAKKNEKVLIGVAGCVAQAEGEEIVARAPFVDLVFGPQTYHRLPEMVRAALRTKSSFETGSKIIETEFATEEKFDELSTDLIKPTNSFITIQEGCNKFCSFCVVPYTRGAEISRPADQILKEAESLVRLGSKEVTLLGQNVNAYHGTAYGGKEWTLGRLIRKLAEIEGLERIRYTTSHPKDMDDDLILAHGEVPQLMPYLHLPVQSGSDSILQIMNRKHNISFYRKIIDKLRKAREDIAFSSDFIVGYPGESDTDFAATLKLVSDVEFAQAYSFKYSPRPGTPASNREQVNEQTKSDRLESLQQLLDAQQLAFNLKKIGTTQSILIEKPGNKEGQLAGKTPYMQATHFCGPENLIGSITKVRILDGFSKGLAGDIVKEDEIYSIQKPDQTQTEGQFLEGQNDWRNKNHARV